MTVYPRAPLGQVCQINPRSGKRASPSDQLVSFVPMSAVDEHLGVISSFHEKRLAEVSSGYTSFQNGDVLFAKITPCMENGKAALAENLTNGLGRGSTEFYVLRPGDRVLGEYVYHFVRQKRFRNAARQAFTGTAGQQRVPKSFIDRARIPLPPLDEQHRIVDIMNRATKIERLRAKAAECLREFVPALFIKMFGDPVTNPMGWKSQTLGNCCLLIRYGTSRKANGRGEGVPVLRMGNVTYGGDLDLADLKHVSLADGEMSKYGLQPGDILFNRTNSRELVGKTGLWDGRFPAVAASYFIRLRLDECRVLPGYVWAAMNSAAMKGRLFAMARGAIGQANINARELGSIPVPVPDLALQARFVSVLNDAVALRDLGKQSVRNAVALSTSLLDGLLGDSE